MLLRRFLVVTAVVICCQCDGTYDLSGTNYTVGETNTITISANRTSATAADTVQIDFPADFNVGTFVPSSCTLNGTTLGGNITNPNTTTLLIDLSSLPVGLKTSLSLSFKLVGLTNPTYVTRITNIIVKFLSSGTNIENAILKSESPPIETQPGFLSPCTWKFTSQTNSNGSLALQFTLAHTLPAGNNVIFLGFANGWSGILNSTAKYGMTSRNSILSTFSNSNIQVNSPSAITITVTNVVATSTSLTISMTSASVPFNTVVSITIVGVLTPPLETISSTTEQLVVTTKNQYGIIDQSTVCDVLPTPPFSLACSLNSTGAQVSTPFKLQGSLGNILYNEMQIGDGVAITYPSGTTLVSNNLYFRAFNQDVYSNTSTPINSTNQNMILSQPKTITYTVCDTVFTFGLANSITLPNSIAPIDFNFTFTRSGVRYMQCLSQLTGISNGTISSILLTSSTSVVGATMAAYNITFTPQNRISAGGGFIVTLQSDVGLSSFSGSCSSNPDVTPTCTKDSTSNAIIVNVASAVPAAGALSIVFNNLQNPASPYTSINVSIRSFNVASLMNTTTIDSGSGTPAITYTAATLPAVTVSSSTCSGNTLESCAYNLSYSNTVALQVGTVVQLKLPSNFAAVSSYTSTFKCGSQAAVNAMTFVSPLQYLLTAQCPIASSLLITFKATNPSLTITVGSLQLTHLTAATGGVVIQQLLTGININVPNPSLFSVLLVTNDAPTTTGQSGPLTFNFQPSVPLPVLTYFSIDYPSDFPSGWDTATCTGCTIFSRTTSNIVVQTTALAASGTTSNFKINGVKFPRSALPCIFKVTAYADSALHQAYHTSETTFAMKNFSTMTFGFQPGVLNYKYSSDPVLLTFTFSNALKLGDVIQVDLSSTVYTRNSSVAIVSDSLFSLLAISSNIVNATVISSALTNTANMSISGFTTINSSTPIGNIVATHSDSGGYLSDGQATLAFTLTCKPPCKRCSASNQSSCSECYDKTVEASYYVYNSSTSTCVSVCSLTSQYYANTTNMCQLCSSPCLQCINQTFCMSCLSPSDYLFANGTCNSTCPSVAYFNTSEILTLSNGTYTQKKCSDCDTNCNQCVNSSTTCLNCKNPAFVLWPNNLCTATACQAGYYNNSGICSPCLTNCSTCDNPINCTACLTGYVFNYLYQCVNQCGSQVLYPGSKKCGCGPNCVSCSVNINNCTSCVSTYYLQNGSCGSSCSSNTYNSSGVCYTCPVGCSTCSSSQLCSACLSPFYWYNNNCISDCGLVGDGYVNNDVASPKTCSKCANGCSVCVATQPSNCSACLANYTLNNLTKLCECSNCNSTTTILCPAGFVLDGGSCVVGKATISGQVSIAMYSIASVSWAGFCLISKLFSKAIFVQYGLISALGPLETTTYMVLLGFTIPTSSRRLLASTTIDSGTICVIVSLVLNYVLNAVHLWVYFKYISTDQQFPKNKKLQRNRVLNIVLLVVATLTNFRLYQIVFSSLCGAKLLKTRLLNISKFMPINLLNCSNIVVSVIALAGFGLVCANSVSSQSQYYLAIVAIVVTVMTIIFTLASFLKDQDFFEVVCKYDLKDEISNTQESLEKGEEHHFHGNSATKGKNYKIMNEPSVMHLANEEDNGDFPINKKSSFLGDPLKPIVIRTSSPSFPEIDISNNDNFDSDVVENSDNQSKEDVAGRSNSKIRRKASRRIEQRPSRNPLRVQDSSSGQEQVEEEKVETIINELESEESLQSQFNFKKKNSFSPSDNPQPRQLSPSDDQPKKHLNRVQVHAQDGNSESGDKHISSTRVIQIKSKQPEARQSSAQLLQPNSNYNNNRNSNNSPSDTLSENTQPLNQKIDLGFVEKFYHEGNFDFSEPDIEYNEVSPSQFNIENQRFDDSVANIEPSESGDNLQLSPRGAAARSTPLKNFSLEELKKDFD